MTNHTEALALFIGGPLDGKRERVPAEWEFHHPKGGPAYEAWAIPAPPGKPPVRVFAPVGSTKEDVFWTLVVGFSRERAMAAAGRAWDADLLAYCDAKVTPRPRDDFIQALLDSGILRK